MTTNWIFYIEADTIKEKDLILKKIEDKLDLPLEAVTAERYWKKPSQFRVLASTMHSDKSFEETVVVAIQKASLLYTPLSVTYVDDILNGVSHKSKIAGLETFFFEIGLT